MQRRRLGSQDASASATLVRSGFVPLYYQLQEILKEQIESGAWGPGDALPSEPELARRYGVSRVVVRQALAILEDDHQIVRVRGRGTFVTEPKVDMRAGGLARLLAGPREPGMTILVLDRSQPPIEQSIRDHLGAGDDEDVLRVTTQLSLRDKPLAITYSFFRQRDVGWLESAAQPGRTIGSEVTLSRYGLALATSHVSIETSQCGQFEADRFGVAYRSSVFLVHSTEHISITGGAGERPLEFARAEYRGDMVQLQVCSSADPCWFSTGPHRTPE